MDKTFCISGDSVTQAAYVKTGWVELFRQFLEEKYPDDFQDGLHPNDQGHQEIFTEVRKYF